MDQHRIRSSLNLTDDNVAGVPFANPGPQGHHSRCQRLDRLWRPRFLLVTGLLIHLRR